MLSVIHGVSFMLNIVNQPFMLSVVMLNVAMLSVLCTVKMFYNTGPGFGGKTGEILCL
jgi:hypothetical protein